MAYFLGIDLGASSLKACLVDDTGRRTGMSRAAITTRHPAAGHAEQAPQDWRTALKTALAELRTTHASAMTAIGGMAFSGGAHIGVLCDGAGAPLRDAIMWSDQRAAPQADALATDGQVEAISGNRPNATWTLPQLIWLAAHEPQIIAATEKLFFAKDWLAFQLTGMHTGDKTEAVGSMMATQDGVWHETLQGLSELAASAFPPLVAPMAQCGEVSETAAQEFGLAARIPVYQGAIDTSLEWLCAAPQTDNIVSLKLASAGVLAFTTTETRPFPPVSFYPHIIEGRAYHAAGMSDCMGAINWMRETMTPHLTATDFAMAAEKAEAGADGLLFYPYLSGARAPFWDASRRAEIYGLTRAHGTPALARAAFEGVGHVLTAIWHDMTTRLGHTPDMLHVLGGGSHLDFFCQMLADMLGVTLCRGEHNDCAFATALLAATAGGAFPDLANAAQSGYAAAGQFVPDTDLQARYAGAHEKFMARHK